MSLRLVFQILLASIERLLSITTNSNNHSRSRSHSHPSSCGHNFASTSHFLGANESSHAGRYQALTAGFPPYHSIGRVRHLCCSPPSVRYPALTVNFLSLKFIFTCLNYCESKTGFSIGSKLISNKNIPNCNPESNDRQ